MSDPMTGGVGAPRDETIEDLAFLAAWLDTTFDGTLAGRRIEALAAAVRADERATQAARVAELEAENERLEGQIAYAGWTDEQRAHIVELERQARWEELWQDAEAERDAALAKVARVEALCERAEIVQIGVRPIVYVPDVRAALADPEPA